MVDNYKPAGDSLGSTTRRRFLATTGTATGLAVGFAGCLGDDDEFVLDANAAGAEGTVHGDVSRLVGDIVEEETGGQIQINSFTDGELGDLIESIENVAAGDLDIYVNVYGLAAALYPDAQVLDTPYMYDDDRPYEHMIEVSQREAVQDLIEDIADETGMRSLGTFPQGTRRVTIAGDAATNPEEMSEKLLRAVPVPVFEESVAGIGAQVTELEWGEVPQALATGQVDGQENPYDVMVGAGIHEHTDYVIETDHMHPAMAFWINDDLWNEFSADQQDIFYEAIEEAQPQAIDQLEETIEENKQVFRDEGAEILEPDDIEFDAFRSRTREHIREQFPDWVDTIEEIMGEEYR